MLLGNFRINKRILSLTILIAVHCGGGNIWCSAEDVWNATIQDTTIKFVQQLRATVDASKQPCDDFYGYICSGNRSTAHQVTLRPSEEDIFRQFLLNDDEEQLMDVELKLKRFYESCQNSSGVEHLKSSHLYRITGGWPAIERSTGAKRREPQSWMNVIASFHDIGVDYFFKHRVEIKSNQRHVQLEANLDFKYSLRKKTQLAETLLQSYDIDSSEARMIALDFAGLEGYRREVAKVTGGASSTMTYREFKAKYINIDWDVYFRRALGKPLRDIDNIRLEDEQKLERIFDILSKTSTIRLLNYVWIDYLLDKGTGNCLDLVREYFQPVYRYIVQRSSIDKRRIVQMFSEIGGVYQSLLPESVWIDEISNEKSKLYLGKMIHMTLNGDAKLDADYASLTLTKKNFYRNLEKCQRFTESMAAGGDARRIVVSSSSASLSDLYEFFMGPMYNELLPTALYYGSIGRAFAEQMIDGGGNSLTPGSWRSSDSDEKYADFERCLREQNVNFASSSVIGNNLVRRILAERQTYEALRNWISANGDMVNRIREALTQAVSGELSLEKLYFYISVSTHCGESKQFVNTYLKNTRDFAEVFGCPSGSTLKPSKVCNIL